MEGCLAVNAEGRNGGLIMMWKDSKQVEIQTYSSNHIDSLIHVENDSPFASRVFMWIIRGDFNALLDEAEKEGGRRKAIVLIEDFRSIVDELSMVDLKTDNGWLTWVNNREGTARVKERLHRFLMSANAVNSFPFLETRVIRQSSSNHDAISLDTEVRRPRDGLRDPRLSFKYDICWARNEEAKMIIEEAWQRGSQDTLEKISIVGKELGRMKKNNIARLKDINGYWRDNTVDICKGDFNAILNDAEKEGGRRGVRAHMNDFKAVMDDLALVDIKPDSGWFTWVNNRNGGGLIKERIDRFLISVSLVENFPFIAIKVVRQTQSDHDAILLDLWGRRLKDHPNDHRLSFKFDLCWAGDREAKKIIGSVRNRGDIDYGEKIERVRSVLGYWQRKKYGKMKSEIRRLEKNIDRIIDSSSRGDSVKNLKEYHKRLDFLYAREESYWAQRSRSKWFREGDRNTRYFHAKATGRLKKNLIEKIKDMDGNWVASSKDISQVAKNYFLSLFRSNGQRVDIQEVGYIQECVTREANEWLTREYTENEVVQVIKQMDPNKAPGIDGLSGNFFKHHWEIVGCDTINLSLTGVGLSHNDSPTVVGRSLALMAGVMIYRPVKPVPIEKDALCLPSRQPIGALALPRPCLHLKLPVTPKKLVVGLRGGSAGPPHNEHRSARLYYRRYAIGLNWLGRSSDAVTLKKLECSKTPLAPYEKSKSLGSGGNMVARLKLKGIDGRAPPRVELAA
ncbi:hypothetical protein GOBAR_AA35375 [Gossypium barbadense]|uniref:Endonuclease/exonuclease/phosphatase domain-containing protein n=1 Tax=Gossypium barbadense TaxID=3634 RepID=A0A2P5W2J3_GOSBA|nr:hypothetical protein GOBAR_AA35375 [Gossypium barbadense]